MLAGPLAQFSLSARWCRNNSYVIGRNDAGLVRPLLEFGLVGRERVRVRVRVKSKGTGRNLLTLSWLGRSKAEREEGKGKWDLDRDWLVFDRGPIVEVIDLNRSRRLAEIETSCMISRHKTTELEYN